jgi:DNA-binding MarR family transcriptional regulator
MSEPVVPCESATLLMLLVRVSAALEARLEQSVEPCGLSLAKVGALHHLANAPGPLPLGQLADRLCCVRSNVTQLVDRLEADGLVRRVPDPQDRRSVLAVITEAGRERFDAARAAKEQAQAGMLGTLDAAERETLRRLLQRLADEADPATST